MATKFNLPLAVAVLALAIIAWSFLNSGLQGYLVVTPMSTSCVDSDGWDNTQKGTCTDSRGTYTESCLDFNSPGEYYCTPSKVCQLRAMDCPFDKSCVDGVCV